MLDHSYVTQEILKILRSELQDESICPEPTTELDRLPGWDSIAMSCIFVAVEHRFDFEFSGHEMNALARFGDLISLVIKKGDERLRRTDGLGHKPI